MAFCVDYCSWIKKIFTFIMTKNTYSLVTGILKTAKNSAYLLVPFALALLVTVPVKYAWIAGPVVYMLKNYYENKK